MPSEPTNVRRLTSPLQGRLSYPSATEANRPGVQHKLARVLVVGWFGIAVGCGVGAYEERLKKSASARHDEVMAAKRAAEEPPQSPAEGQPGAAAAVPNPVVPGQPAPGQGVPAPAAVAPAVPGAPPANAPVPGAPAAGAPAAPPVADPAAPPAPAPGAAS
ncbi:MAG: hypothetical protein K2Y37_10870 [Pirellulales bacterium]|nr:hypothetical protein [Pirellulales bacterium]